VFADPSDLGLGSITGYGGKLSVVVDVEVGDDMKLYQSLDGGNTFPYVFPLTLPPVVTILHMDAFADIRGVHIVWSNESETEVYYVLFNQETHEFDPVKNVTDINIQDTGKRPKVVASPNKAHVSFIKTDESPEYFGATRDVDYSTPEPTWDTDYRRTASMPQPAAQQRVALRSSQLHMILVEESGAGDEDMYSTDRLISGNWNPLIDFDGYGQSSEPTNHRRTITLANDTLYATYAKTVASGSRGIVLKTYPSGA
jgi:hypothetical protein